MKKTRKRIARAIILFGLIFGLVFQASASWSAWHTFRLPSGQRVVAVNQNGNPLSRTTSAAPSNAVTRRARIESRGQTMWSNPQVRVHRRTSGASWTSSWSSVSNNNHVYINMPMVANITYVLNARSAWNQVGTDNASFRMNVQRFTTR